MAIPAEARLIYSGEHANVSSVARANEKSYKLRFKHVPTGHSVQFPAILQSFSDNHKPKYVEEHGYNRMDPTIRHQGTSRTVNFTFSVFNGSIEEARHNAQNINLLISMLYPLLDNQNRIIGKPFIRVHGLNFLNNSVNDGVGLLCVIQSIDYNLDLEQGVISSNEDEIYPKKIDIDIACETIIEVGLSETWYDEAQHPQNTPVPLHFPKYLKT